VEAGLVYQSGVPPQARYLFKHALVQDTAYQSLLRSRRAQLHHQVAEVLTGQFAETVKTQPELVAHHYTEAGSIELAIPYWQQAGQRALLRSAHAEAVGHFTKGLELLKTLPQTGERTEQELVLQTALGPALMVTTGYTSAEVEQTYTRALELCRQVGGTPQLFPVLRGLWEFYEMRGELQTARELAEQLLTLIQNDQDPALLVIAHDVMGDTLFFLGEFTSAREHVEQGIALYDFQQHRSLAFLHGGYDPGMACLCYLAFALWHLGYPDQAVKQSQEALTLAQELAHPFSLAMALYVAARLSCLDREVERAQEQAEALIALATEQEFSFFLAQGTILRGWVLAMQGQGEKGIAEMRRGIAASRTTGTELFQLHSLARLAEGYGKARHGEEGLTALVEALALIDTTGERWYEAELYRLKGELTLQSPASGPRSQVASEAEECFHRALDIARTQQAKSLELRAGMSLSRLWQQQGKREEAHLLLAEIYRWFTEGFDTKDLQEAKALLEELT
jgi:predicted ATPase